MKRRRWVLYLAFLITSIVIVSYYALRIVRANERIKKFLVTEMQQVFGESSDIQKVRVSINRIHLKSVYFPLPDAQLSLFIDDLRIGYNFFDLLIRGFDPRKISPDLLAVHPRLEIFQLPADSTIREERAKINLQELEGKYEHNIKQLGNLRRLVVDNGEIFLNNEQNQRYQLAKGIKGLLIPESADSIQIVMSGNLFSSQKENLFIHGKADLTRGIIAYAEVELEDYALDEQFSALFKNFIQFSGGKLDGLLRLSRSKILAERFDLNGRLQIKDTNANILNEILTIEKLKLSAIVKDWNVFLEESTQIVNGAKVKVGGGVKNILNPQLDIDLSVNSLDLSNFRPILNQSIVDDIKGKVNSHISITGPATNPHFSAQLKSDRIFVFDQPVSDLVIAADYEKDILSIKKWQTNFAYNMIDLKARVDLSKSTDNVGGTISVNGDILPLVENVATDTLKACPTWLQADISGSLENPTFFGDVGMAVVTKTNDSLKTRAEFALQNRKATFTSVAGNESPGILGRIDFNTQSPQFNFSFSKFQPAFYSLFNIPQESYLQNNTELSANIAGNLEEFDVDLNLSKVEKGYFINRLVALNGTVRNNKNGWLSRGIVKFHPNSSFEMEGYFHLVKEGDTLSVKRISLENDFLATATINLSDTTNKCVDGHMTFSNLQTSRLFGLPDSVFSGNLEGLVELTGTRQKPQIYGNLMLQDVNFNQSGDFGGEFSFAYDSLGFSVKKFELTSQNVEQIAVDGGYDKSGLDFSIKGDGLDMKSISAVSSKFLTTTGRGHVDINISGSFQQPEIIGSIGIMDGSMLHIPFDELELSIGKQPIHVLSYQPLKKPLLYFDDIKLVRHNDFEMHGIGFLPINLNDSLDIQIEGKGDFLSLLGDVSSFFKNSSSNGRLSARLNGTFEEPSIQDAKIHFTGGIMEFGSVIPKITEVSGDIEFEPANQFVHIHQLEGKMGGRDFRISNSLSNPGMASRQLEDLEFGDDGINFGVTSFETSEEGVPLNILGLMERDVYGHLQLFGRTDKEMFYFAGPTDRPTLRGNINLKKFRFMFPFDGGGSEPNEFIMNLLMNMEWDIGCRAVEDVRYVNTLPGAIDNVYVNLQMDEKYGGLDFQGQMNDETFRIIGEARSTTGLIEYLDMEFRMDHAFVEFDKSDLIPVVSGQARTTVTDTLGISSQIFLTVQTTDETMDEKQVDDNVLQNKARGRWTDIQFKLSTDNPNLGNTEAQILASLGYSTENLSTKAFDAIGIGTENYLFRPLYRPVERKLEKVFGLDYIRFSSRFTRNLLALNLNHSTRTANKLSLLRSTKLVFGKFLTNQLFFQYTGQIEAGLDYQYQEKGLGLRHTFAVDYKINPQLMLELEYDYNSLIIVNKDDTRIVLRHWFPF